ncbi:MAG: hypothetical protein ACFFD4_25370, partial [Candidatus Odinarchaeota archaeon]
ASYYKEIICSEFSDEALGTRIQITGYYFLSESDEPYISDTTGELKLVFKEGKVPDLEHGQTARVYGETKEDALEVDHITGVNIDLSRFLHLKDLEKKL